MRAQRFGEALLRAGPSPVLPFLAPSASPSTWTPIYRKLPFHVKGSQRQTTLRCLATKTSTLNASAATATKVEVDEGEAHPPSYHPEEKASTASLLNSVVKTNVATSRRNTPYAARDGPTSADLFRESRARSKRSITDIQGSIANQALGGEFNDLSTQNLLVAASKRVTPAPPLPPPVRLDAFVGRSEDVDPLKGVDLGKAIRKLEIKCAYNNVRQDFNKQRFHERPGLKRKRLKSQRWRKRFREGFNAVVSKVQKMRMKGW